MWNYKNLSKNIDIKMPDGICVQEDMHNQLVVTLGINAVTKNMQTDAAAFEGWIFAILAQYSTPMNVVIKIPDDMLKYGEEDKNIGHYNRFLYRITKLCHKYDNIEVAPNCKLKSLLGTLFYNGEYINIDQLDLITNIPEKDASVNNKPEILMEREFAENPAELFKESNQIFKNKIQNFKINGNKANRQLPVGIFVKEVKKGKNVFTSGASAIDLWALTDDAETLCIYELKAQNPMVGIVSELFFYSNLMEDIYVNNIIKYKKKRNNYRGFENLVRAYSEIRNIAAVFLADEFHPLFNDKIIDLLNTGKGSIVYGKMDYQYKISLTHRTQNSTI